MNKIGLKSGKFHEKFATFQNQFYFIYDFMWSHQLLSSHSVQLCNKFAKETILFLWRNDKYFFNFAYHLSAVWLHLRQNSMQKKKQ